MFQFKLSLRFLGKDLWLQPHSFQLLQSIGMVMLLKRHKTYSWTDRRLWTAVFFNIVLFCRWLNCTKMKNSLDMSKWKAFCKSVLSSFLFFSFVCPIASIWRHHLLLDFNIFNSKKAQNPLCWHLKRKIGVWGSRNQDKQLFCLGDLKALSSQRKGILRIGDLVLT